MITCLADRYGNLLFEVNLIWGVKTKYAEASGVIQYEVGLFSALQQLLLIYLHETNQIKKQRVIERMPNINLAEQGSEGFYFVIIVSWFRCILAWNMSHLINYINYKLTFQSHLVFKASLMFVFCVDMHLHLSLFTVAITMRINGWS